MPAIYEKAKLFRSLALRTADSNAKSRKATALLTFISVGWAKSKFFVIRNNKIFAYKLKNKN